LSNINIPQAFYSLEQLGSKAAMILLRDIVKMEPFASASSVSKTPWLLFFPDVPLGRQKWPVNTPKRRRQSRRVCTMLI